MKSMLKGLVLSAALLVLTGCGVSGKWSMQSIKPESAKESFNAQMLCLNDDGSYVMCATEKGKCEQFKGKYKYDANAKTLTFTGDDGKARTYTAEVVSCGNEMKIAGGEKGKEWTAMMKKEGPCSKECCQSGHKCDEKCGKSCQMKKDDGKKEPDKKEVKAEKKDEPKKAEAKKEEPKKPDTKKDEPKKAEPKKDTDKDKK